MSIYYWSIVSEFYHQRQVYTLLPSLGQVLLTKWGNSKLLRWSLDNDQVQFIENWSTLKIGRNV
jgi:hypothetical protein